MGIKKAVKGISENDLRLIQRLKACPKLHKTSCITLKGSGKFCYYY